MRDGMKCDRCDSIANYTRGGANLCGRCEEIDRRERSLARRTGDDWFNLRAALAWKYGPDRAQAIMSGRDDATNADLAKWRTLGEPK
jgi:hypothetical protein